MVTAISHPLLLLTHEQEASCGGMGTNVPAELPTGLPGSLGFLDHLPPTCGEGVGGWYTAHGKAGRPGAGWSP